MSARDIDATTACFASRPDCVFIGSGLDERRVGPEEIRAHFSRDFAQSEWLSMSWLRRDAIPIGDAYAAWGVGDIEAHVGSRRVDTRFRFTAAIARFDGHWRFLQGHLSLPSPGQQEGESWPASIEHTFSRLTAGRLDKLAEESPDGTVTLLFTDIENSSQAQESLGDSAWLEIVRRHSDAVARCAASNDGEVVKSLGDGFMVAFRSALNGVACALDLQRMLSGMDGTAPLRVRMGLHTGEMIRDGVDFFGLHVTQASRIAALAGGGQILVSGPLRDLIERDGRYLFHNPREVELKGLSGNHRVYEVAAAADDAAPQRR